MTLTETQLDALAFFEEQLAFVEAAGLANLEREERRLFTAGKKVAEAVTAGAKAAAKRRR